MSYKRGFGTSYEQAAKRYLDGEYINVIIPADLGEAIGCSAVRAGVLLRSLGWYGQRSGRQKNTTYYRRNPNRRIRI